MKLRGLSNVIEAQETSDGAGVRLRRSIGSRLLDHVDPFLLLDEFKSDSPDDYIAGFPDHPHRGFETVTYLLAGSMEHRDHNGNHGLLAAGSVQWMTAGRGIIHSEMPRQERGLLWGFQLWVNLPAQLKLCPPRYQDIAPEAIPAKVYPSGVRVRVVAGESDGLSGPVKGIATDPLYFEVSLPAQTSFERDLPPGHSAMCYVFDGELEIDGKIVGSHHLAVLDDGDRFAARSLDSVARFLLLAARPIGEPIARYGPFVMNTREEIRTAMQDLEKGTFLG